MKQSEITSLHDGLKRELAGVTADTFNFGPSSEAMDEYLQLKGL
jgi:hypothetical protein